MNSKLKDKGTSPLKDQGATLYELLKRPELDWDDVIELSCLSANGIEPEVREEVEIRAKYKGYLKKQEKRLEQFRRMEDTKIPDSIDYNEIEGLSTEGREKLLQVQPRTLGQAERIPGVSRADITILTVWMK